jgi:NAD-dependent dihydropyrimidine dehydrogenase PreA subunit
MAVRKIVRIDEELCDGCGNCVTTCAEGALQIVDGKARLVRELFCDGFGDCVGECPTGALTIEERESEPFDFQATRAHVAATGGATALLRLEEAARQHESEGRAGLPVVEPSGSRHSHSGGCPGSRVRFSTHTAHAEAVGADGPKQAIPSELRQWPVQLHLVQPGNPFFHDREMVVLSTCGPVASADVHWRFLRGRSVVVACPKLDDTRPYAAKLGAILRDPSIPKVIVVRMEVPCCGGLTAIARDAAELSGRRDLVLEEVTLGVNGDVQTVETQELPRVGIAAPTVRA